MFVILIICLIITYIFLKKSTISVNTIPLPTTKPIMFGRVSCPYTVKMINELKKHKVFDTFQYINTETKHGSQLMHQYGGKGVPFFVHKNRKGHGFMPKSNLFEKLNL